MLVRQQAKCALILITLLLIIVGGVNWLLVGIPPLFLCPEDSVPYEGVSINSILDMHFECCGVP
ncbi:hypothetical protein D3C87_2172030 [compost metagenome]